MTPRKADVGGWVLILYFPKSYSFGQKKKTKKQGELLYSLKDNNTFSEINCLLWTNSSAQSYIFNFSEIAPAIYTLFKKPGMIMHCYQTEQRAV